MTGAPISPRNICSNMDELTAALRSRRLALGLSQMEVDARTGLPEGYQGKLEASLTNPEAKNARAIGRMSLPLVLGALGVEIVVVPKGSTKVRTPMAPADAARLGGKKRADNLSPERRREIAAKAAAARWATRKEASL